MPALSPVSLRFLGNLADQTVAANLSLSAIDTNSSTGGLGVICAWPVSSQYGPGSRILYYTVVATCVFARKAEWLRNACLAAALVFPVVAAVHGIVLAATHVNDAVDLDIYGAFQLCAIGILAGPVTVRRSSTYFNSPGRNIIFLSTGLSLAGLLSLTVEFYRSSGTPCKPDNVDPGSGIPVPTNPADFPFDARPSCGLVCSESLGPASLMRPLRTDGTTNIYVIPTPDRFDFGTAMLFAAACCIPAILSLVSMWDKIQLAGWKMAYPGQTPEGQDPDLDKPIAGTNGATEGTMRSVNSMIKFLLSIVEIPIFAAAVVAILVMGERNFWSRQLLYGTESMVSVGQWAPIVTAGLAAFGSLYILLAEDVKAVEEEEKYGAKPGPPIIQIRSNCNCSHQVPHQGGSSGGQGSDSELVPSTRDGPSSEPDERPATAVDRGYRDKVARGLRQVGKFLGTPAPDRFDDSGFQLGPARVWPEVPAEPLRSENLSEIRRIYIRSHSRSASPGPSAAEPTDLSLMRQGECASAVPRDQGPLGPQNSPRHGTQERTDTLEVPSPTYHNFIQRGRQQN